MTKGKKRGLLIAIVAVIVVAIIVVAVCLWKMKGTDEVADYVRDVEDVEVAEMYRCMLGDTTYIDYRMEADGTFDNQVNGSSFATGTYEVQANEVTLTSEGTDKKYVLDGEYLIPEECFFVGTIPEDDLFQAEVTYNTGEEDVTLSFAKDGTFTYVTVSEEDGTSTVTGTYERDGNLLKRYDEDGEEMVSLYVYDGYLASLYYVETEVPEEE